MLSDAKKTLIRKLQNKKHRTEMQKCIIEGEKGVFEAIRSGAQVAFIVLAVSYRGAPIPAEHEIEIFDIFDDEAKKLTSTVTFSGILAVVAIPQAKELVRKGPIVYLDGIADPGNLGTIFRTAEWFGITQIVLGPGCSDPYNEKALRASMGSLFRIVPRVGDPALIEILKQDGYTITGLDMQGSDDASLLEGNVVLVVGSESHGISPELETALDNRYTIAGGNETESLNAAIAAAIVFSRLTV